jgi:hypothetical protein
MRAVLDLTLASGSKTPCVVPSRLEILLFSIALNNTNKMEMALSGKCFKALMEHRPAMVPCQL